MGGPQSREEAEAACKARLERQREAPTLFRYFDGIASGVESRVHVILGQTGSGKSTLALLYLMRRYDCDLEEIFDRIVWRPDHFLEKYGEGRDVLVWDDAGVWFRLLGKIHWDPLSITLTSIYDVGRLHVPLVLMTMVSDRDLPRGLRYNSFIYRSRTRVWRASEPGRQATRAVAVTQFRREKQDWSQSYWDTGQEYVYKFYHFREGDPFYRLYLETRREYARFFLRYAMRNLERSKLYELLQQQG